MDRKHTEQFILWKCFRVFCPLELRLRLEQVRVSFSLPKLLILTVFSIYQLPAVILSWVLACWLHSQIHMYFLSAQTLTLVSLFLLLFRNFISAPVVYLVVKHSLKLSWDIEEALLQFASLTFTLTVSNSKLMQTFKHQDQDTCLRQEGQFEVLVTTKYETVLRKEWIKSHIFPGSKLFMSWEGETGAYLTHKHTRPPASTPSLITTSLSNPSPPYDPSVTRRYYSF